MTKANLTFSALALRWLKARRAMMAGETLTQALAIVPGEYRAAVQSLLYAAVRRRAFTEFLIGRLTERTPSGNVYALLELGLTCLIDGSVSDFTVTNQLVDAVKRAEGAGAGRFINAVLRRYLREKETLNEEALQSDAVRYNAPSWWLERMRAAAPDTWRGMLEMMQKHPPLTVRLNPKRLSHECFLTALAEKGLTGEHTGEQAYIISPPVPVTDIPGFSEGAVSVQDAGTQLAAQLLPVRAGDRVLDACAAPGGKTAHLLETVECRMTALEISPARARRMKETLSRLNLSADIVVADASRPDKWFDGLPFDAILLDAPCSASGVTRRNPDVPWVRTPESILELSATQSTLLNALWPLLARGGHLLFVTCSIFPEEGIVPITKFLSEHDDAVLTALPGSEKGMMTLIPREAPWDGTSLEPGTHDGFFYALLRKA